MLSAVSPLRRRAGVDAAVQRGGGGVPAAARGERLHRRHRLRAAGPPGRDDARLAGKKSNVVCNDFSSFPVVSYKAHLTPDKCRLEPSAQQMNNPTRMFFMLSAASASCCCSHCSWIVRNFDAAQLRHLPTCRDTVAYTGGREAVRGRSPGAARGGGGAGRGHRQLPGAFKCCGRSRGGA